MIVGCVTLYGERVDQALVGIKRLRPYIDKYIVIVDESVTEEQKQKLKESGCEVYFHPWEDHLAKARNHGLEKCQTDVWVIVHDEDEWFNQKFCEDVRHLVKKAEQRGIDRLLINSHDVLHDADGQTRMSVSFFFKHLIFQKHEGTHYVGKVHESLIIPGQKGMLALPIEYCYEHVKYWYEVWERAARNVFRGGGGNNLEDKNPSWKPLLEICNSIGLDSWPKAREYFRRGKIDSRLKKWLWDNRSDGFDYQEEMMDFGRWYFEYLHPEENTDGWKPIMTVHPESYEGILRYIEKCYLEVLGRHADQSGKENYARLIQTGQIRREDLRNILMSSPEWKERFGQK